MATTSGLFVNPVSQMWISKVVPHLDIKGFLSKKRPKMAQYVNSAFFTIVHHSVIGTFACIVMLFVPAYFKNFEITDGKENLKTKFATSYAASTSYWPIILFSSYNFVPTYLRQSLIDVAAFLHGIFTSYISNRNKSDFR